MSEVPGISAHDFKLMLFLAGVLALLPLEGAASVWMLCVPVLLLVVNVGARVETVRRIGRRNA